MSTPILRCRSFSTGNLAQLTRQKIYPDSNLKLPRPPRRPILW